MAINQISRFIISFSWIYHGLVPKLIWIAPLEQEMTASFGFSDEISVLISRSAGIGEIVFGIVFFLFYKSKLVNYANILALTGLLFFVALFNPHLLGEGFNPVTTNLPLIAFSIVLILNSQTSGNASASNSSLASDFYQGKQ